MSSEESLADIDRALISIFLNELPGQVEILQKCAAALHSAPHDKNSLEGFIKTFQAIIQGGKIIRFDSIVTSGK